MVARPIALLLSFYVVGSAHQAPTPVTTFPKLKTKVEAAYTEAARTAGIQGEVWIEAVIDATGRISRATVIKSLDKVFGLDEQAMFAAGQWTFEPGTTNGVAAEKTVTLILEFKPKSPVALTQVPEKATPPTVEFGRGAYRPGPGVTNPILITKVEPKYTSAAGDAGIKGEVWLDAVVMPNGSIGDVRVAKSLDAKLGRDESAVAAAKRWLFRPGLVNGVAVPVLVTLVLEFK